MADYKEELELDDPLAVKSLIGIIREIIRDELRKLPFNKMLPCVVTDVGVDVADIQLFSSGDVIPSVPNKTGEVLNIGDECYIEMINGSSSNIYICLKK